MSKRPEMRAWVLFGGAVVGQAVAGFTWQVVLYALLSLTVVRMLPVFLVLAGNGLRTDEKLFMGWFGPRGLASIVFAVYDYCVYPYDRLVCSPPTPTTISR